MRFQNPLKLSYISELVNAEKFIGSPDFEIYGINEIHVVQSGDLTFVDHPKYYSKALNSKANTIIINKEVDCPEGKSLIISDDPFKAYLILVNKFRPFEASNSIISSTAEIGEGTIIQPSTFVGNNVRIGKNCLIHSNVSIYDHTIIGDDVIIHSGSVLGADAFYFQKRTTGFVKFESCGRVVIKDKVEIGALCSIDRGVSGDTTIDEDTKLDNHCQIGHDTYIGKHCLIGSHAAIAGVTRIENNVIIWGRVAINKDLVIGEGAIVLATTAVDKNLEAGGTYFGIPAERAAKKWREMAVVRKLPELLLKNKL
ncbi:MAG: UDP-3-O-(3-hydroxymyristoyl)glucosamine N-acyltransferase [Bacteroidetes bacterium CG2_30_33_31]|nr:MAG: UDP-3-O-(3-hydroxymyristoyl)glucosamine N-acyltransferase [Bacteroidetes bacterium CG2_30_33_31]